MTEFVRDLFVMDGDYLMYPVGEQGKREFVARFKGSKRDKPGFISFLVKNFTVEEYYKMRTVDALAPVHVLETKGYVSATVKKILKDQGYPTTFEGKVAYLDNQVKKHYQKA